DGQGLMAGGNHDAAPQDAAQALDMVGRPVRQIEQRALAHALAVPIALAQQDGGRRIPVGDGFDIHGESIAQHRHEINENLSSLHGYTSMPVSRRMYEKSNT